MKTWMELASEAPEIGEAGRRLLVGGDGVAIAFLATASAAGRPHLSPVCPIFCRDDLYLSAAARSPKVRDLEEHGAFALHAFLGPNDEEFQLRGRAVRVDAAGERAAVHEAIPFGSFQRDDPVFRFGIEAVVWVHWERVGQPDTRAVRRRWRAGEVPA